MKKRLTRSRTDRIVAGVMGGIAEYFDVDAVIIRLGYLLLTVFTGFVPGIVGYLLAILVVPEVTDITTSTPVSDDKTEEVL